MTLVLATTAVAAAEPLTVTAPTDGTVLRGGSVATIRWTAAAPLPAGVEEWEAFLSVDGGHYYGTRITPHLDIDLRSFEWRVPNVSSNDVRLLIRMGDEREEIEVGVPLRLSIVADLEVQPIAVHVAASAGESARPGDPGVAVWASGDRGGHEVVVERAPIEATVHPATWIHAGGKQGHAVTPAIATARPSILHTSTIAAAPCARAKSPLLARDILLLVRRRNI